MGSPYYVSPEMLKEKYDFSSDVWALGIVMFMMLKGKAPFIGSDRGEIFDNIQNQKLNIQIEDFSLKAKDLLSKMLEKNPKERIQIHQIL